MKKKCANCGTIFETYVGSGHVKCKICRNPGILRHPDVLTESEAERLVADYIRKNEAMEYLRLGKKWGDTIQSGALSIGSFKTYNPNYCARCGRITNHGQHGHCGGGGLGIEGCMKQNPNAITTCHCTYCGDYTLNDGKGVCLRCNQRNPHYSFYEMGEEWSRRQRLYEKYLRIPLLRYWPDDRTLGEKYWDFIWNHAPKEMYTLLSKGRSLGEIAEEFGQEPSLIKNMIREHAEKNNLENPYPKKARKPRQRKPNGLFCLACNRPLFGNQRKWCDNDDCGGWNDLHPRIVRQCSICLNITETYVGSGYETVCEACSNSPEDAKQRTKEWIKRERESAKATMEMRKGPYKEKTREFTRECDEDVFFGYLKIDFSRALITPIGKTAEDMFDLGRDIQKAWKLCKPMWISDVLKSIRGVNSMAVSCPVYSPSLSGPNGISCLLAPVEDWEISLDFFHFWLDMEGEKVTYLTIRFSDWLQRQYVENKKDIEEIASMVNTTVYRIEYALNQLSIPIRKGK